MEEKKITLQNFFDECINEIATSFQEENLEFSKDSLDAMVFCWTTKGSNGLNYHKVTLDSYSGRKLIELFANLSFLEEREMLESDN